MTGDAAARDAGESLVELLVTVVILGIATVGITGALLATGKASSMHRQQALAQNALRSWAEQTSTGPYTECATAGSFGAPRSALPVGFTATVTRVGYWTGGSFADYCSSDTGVQKVTLTITAPNGLSPEVSQSVAVVVRKPCVSSC